MKEAIQAISFILILALIPATVVFFIDLFVSGSTLQHRAISKGYAHYTTDSGNFVWDDLDVKFVIEGE